jgi:hypothetical protein
MLEKYGILTLFMYEEFICLMIFSKRSCSSLGYALESGRRGERLGEWKEKRVEKIELSPRS